MNEQDDEVAHPGNGNNTSQTSVFKPDFANSPWTGLKADGSLADNSTAKIEDYEDFAEIKASEYAEDIIAAFASVLGEEYQIELDI